MHIKIKKKKEEKTKQKLLLKFIRVEIISLDTAFKFPHQGFFPHVLCILKSVEQVEPGSA